MLLFFWLVAVAVTAAAASSCPVGNMDNLVSFGDSYTDESRKNYFMTHGGQPPPAGTLLPENNNTSNAGYTWGRFVAQKTHAKYYNYAVGGASCSNEIVKREFAQIGAPYPSVMDYQVPAYEADTDYHDLYPDRHADNTVYALWIGTNDLGFGGFLTDDEMEGKGLSDYVECNWEVFDHMYKTGGRRFVLINTVPLDLSPAYRANTGDSGYWPNHTLYPQRTYESKMERQTKGVNALFEVGSKFNVALRQRWPGASLTVFDVHSLFMDIYADPDRYLVNPGDPYDPYHRCNPNNTDGCRNSTQPQDSFLW